MAKPLTTQRWLMFDPDWKPALVGPSGTPRKRWRLILGIFTLGMGPVLLRPLVVMRRKLQFSRALRPLWENISVQQQPYRLVPRLWTALAVLGGPLSFGAVLAFNYLRTGKMIPALLALAIALSILSPPVLEVWSGVTYALAVLVFILWPFITPRAVREHLAFGGGVFSWWVFLPVIVAGSLVYAYIPAGFSQRVDESDRLALLEVEELAPALGENFHFDRSLAHVEKTAGLWGSSQLEYSYFDPANSGLFLHSLYERNSMHSLIPTFGGTALDSSFGPQLPAMLFAFDNHLQTPEPLQIDAWNVSIYKLADVMPENVAGNVIVAQYHFRVVIITIVGYHFGDEALPYLHMLVRSVLAAAAQHE